MDDVPPIACTLSPAALVDREGEWRDVIAGGLRRSEARIDGVRLSFAADVEDRVRSLVALEADCCAWFDGTVTREGDAVVVDLVATGDGVPVLQRMFGAPADPS